MQEAAPLHMGYKYNRINPTGVIPFQIHPADSCSGGHIERSGGGERGS